MRVGVRPIQIWPEVQIAFGVRDMKRRIPSGQPMGSLEGLENYATEIGWICIRFGHLDWMLAATLTVMRSFAKMRAR